MRHRLYIHLVWTTQARARLIDASLARFLCRFLRAMARKEKANTVSHLVKRLKGASSAVAAQEGLGNLGRLYWAKGYSVHSVSMQAMDAVRSYLRRQASHHPDEAISGWEGDVPEYDNTPRD